MKKDEFIKKWISYVSYCGRTKIANEMESDLNKIINDQNIIDNNLLNKAIEMWGNDAQLEMIIEECIELALAIQRLKRKKGDSEQKIADVIDEIADVKIMVRQGELIFGSEAVNERVDFKMKRLVKKLSETIQ